MPSPRHFSSIVVSFCLACGSALALGGCGQKGPLKHPSAPATTVTPQPASANAPSTSTPTVTPPPATPPASGTPAPATEPAPRK